MTVKEYAKQTNQDVSGVYKKIKSGKLDISQFLVKESLSFNHTCKECGSGFSSRSLKSKYCSYTCEYRVYNRKYKNLDWYLKKQKKAAVNQHKKKKKERLINYQNNKMRVCCVCSSVFKVSRNEQKKTHCSSKCYRAHRRAEDNERTKLLADKYIKELIQNQSGIMREFITPELIESKRLTIKLKRQIYEKQRTIKSL